jgi:hypothetical protein
VVVAQPRVGGVCQPRTFGPPVPAGRAPGTLARGRQGRSRRVGL